MIRQLGIFASIIVGLTFTATAFAGDVYLDQTGTTWNESGKFLYVFTLTNATDTRILYGGYSPSSPVYDIGLRHKDRWQEKDMSYCGTGLKTQQLKSGRSVSFMVSPEENENWRVGVTYHFVSSFGIENENLLTCWSPSIKPLSKSSRDLPKLDASKLVEADVSYTHGAEYPYTFLLKNISKQTLFFGGFDKPGVPPIYLNQELHQGKWSDDGQAVWNGDGIPSGFQELSPGRTIKFSIPAQSLDSDWRIGVILFRTDSPKTPEDVYRPVWWRKLPKREAVPPKDVPRLQRAARSARPDD